jgi:hypothetical protein
MAGSYLVEIACVNAETLAYLQHTPRDSIIIAGRGVGWSRGRAGPKASAWSWAEQRTGADALQRPLRCRFRARLTAGVGLTGGSSLIEMMPVRSVGDISAAVRYLVEETNLRWWFRGLTSTSYDLVP